MGIINRGMGWRIGMDLCEHSLGKEGSESSGN